MQRRKIYTVDGFISFTVVSRDGFPFPPFEEYLSTLRADPDKFNSLRTYAGGLAVWGTYIEIERISWDKPTPQIFGRFQGWLRRGKKPESLFSRMNGTVNGSETTDNMEPATVNLYITAVRRMYYYHVYFGRLIGMKLHEAVYQSMNKGISALAPVSAPLSGQMCSPRRRGHNDHLQLPLKKKKPKTLTNIEIDLIINACRDVQEKLFWKTLYDSGLRGAALACRRVEDFDIDNCRLSVKKRSTDPEWVGYKTFDETSKSLTTETMSLFIDTITSKWRETIDTDFVFINRVGKNIGAPWNRDTIYSLVRRIEKRVMKQTGGVFHFDPHWFRHTFGTDVQKKFKNVQLTMELLDQNRLQSIVKYQHMDTDELAAEMKKLHEYRNGSERNNGD